MIWKKSLFMSAPVLFAFMCVVSIHTATLSAQLPPPAHDPGVRGGAAGAGAPLAGLTAGQLLFFNEGFLSAGTCRWPSTACTLSGRGP